MKTEISPEDTMIQTLGERTVTSPLEFSVVHGDGISNFVDPDSRLLYDVEVKAGQNLENPVSFEKSGPYRMIYFPPNDVTVGIMTCGGLCPGLNNVIRAIFMELYYKYNVKNILGIPYGYQGLNPKAGHQPMRLSPEKVEEIHKAGGTILGTSRGRVEPEVMLDSLERHGINILFCLGGDGTQRGLHELSQLARERHKEIAFIGLPKTIDNDISFVFKTFGLDTAVTVADKALASAHFEAKSAYNGIGLVKVMGRASGFIASYATLANLDVNFCLIPEIDFDLDGAGGFLECLQRRLYKRKHAVIVVAEGAGQKFFDNESSSTDASGNPVLNDIGLYLKHRIKQYFKEKQIPVDLKYIDPSYMIRSVPTDSNDSIYTGDLARCAVHCGMAGKTDMLVGLWHGQFVNVPLGLIAGRQKKVNPESPLWRSVLSATGQPISMRVKQ